MYVLNEQMKKVCKNVYFLYQNDGVTQNQPGQESHRCQHPYHFPSNEPDNLSNFHVSDF